MSPNDPNLGKGRASPTKLASVPPAQKIQSRLAAMKPERLFTPFRMVIYGPESIGKSTLAADAPAPVFMDLEDGSGQLVVNRYPFNDEDPKHVPKDASAIERGLYDLLVSPHDRKTLVIDTVDKLETYLITRVLEQYSGKTSALNKGGKQLTSIEDFGYNKGATLVMDEMRKFIHKLEDLRNRREMSIILVGHAHLRTFKNPEGDDYDRYYLRVGSGSQDKLGGLLKEWADIVGFCQFEGGGGKLDDDQDRPKGWTSGRRLIHFKRGAAFDAKSRYPLPDSVELPQERPWSALGEAIQDAQDPTKLAVLIDLELKRIGDMDLVRKVQPEVAKHKTDASTLSRFLQALRLRPAVSTEA